MSYGRLLAGQMNIAMELSEIFLEAAIDYDKEGRSACAEFLFNEALAQENLARAIRDGLFSYYIRSCRAVLHSIELADMIREYYEEAFLG